MIKKVEYMKNNKISLNLAQEIVNAVKEVVDKDINFIDKNGIIHFMKLDIRL